MRDSYFTEDDFNMTPVKSSNIKAVGYLGTTVRIQFTNGRVYDYLNVPEDEHIGFMESQSKGHYFWKVIRNRACREVK